MSVMPRGPELPSLFLELRLWLCSVVVVGIEWDNGWQKCFVNSEETHLRSVAFLFNSFAA